VPTFVVNLGRQVLTTSAPGGMIRAVAEQDPIVAETVGRRLKRLRLERGLSQRDLSEPGVSYAYVSRIEAGARRPSVKALRMLARKLGVTAEYLETGSEVDSEDARELRLAEIELRLRLDGNVSPNEIEDVLEDAVAHADEAIAVRARIALGFAADNRSDHAAVVGYLEDAIRSDLVTPVARPDVYVTLGRAYAASGFPQRAVELFERGLLELAELTPEDLGMRVRFSAYLSFALTDVGELQKARAVVGEALSTSSEAVDPYTRVRLYWSLGRLALEQSRPQTALENFRRAVALLEATEDSLHLARAHMSCAHALIDSNDIADAIRHIEQAEVLLGPRPATDDLAVIRRLQTTCAARTGAFASAERYGVEALELADGLPNEAGQIWWALAEARVGAGDPADGAFELALALLGEHGTVREQAALLRSYGRYLRDAGREREALDVFERAADVAANLQGVPTTAER
jgi:transcriptional regulator with XRE-family HTH domain